MLCSYLWHGMETLHARSNTHELGAGISSIVILADCLGGGTEPPLMGPLALWCSVRKCEGDVNIPLPCKGGEVESWEGMTRGVQSPAVFLPYAPQHGYTDVRPTALFGAQSQLRMNRSGFPVVSSRWSEVCRSMAPLSHCCR